MKEYHLNKDQYDTLQSLLLEQIEDLEANLPHFQGSTISVNALLKEAIEIQKWKALLNREKWFREILVPWKEDQAIIIMRAFSNIRDYIMNKINLHLNENSQGLVLQKTALHEEIRTQARDIIQKYISGDITTQDKQAEIFQAEVSMQKNEKAPNDKNESNDKSELISQCYDAIKEGDIKKIDAVINQVDVNRRDRQGKTLLFYAVTNTSIKPDIKLQLIQKSDSTGQAGGLMSVTP